MNPTAETTIAELLADRPEAAPVLDAFRLDTCCTRAWSLGRAAAERGIPVETLLAALSGGAAPSCATAPSCASGGLPLPVHGEPPPPAPSCGSHAPAAAPSCASPSAALPGLAAELPPLYPRFLRGALLLTLTLGTLFGAFNLIWQAWPMPSGVPRSHVQSHAHAQLFGFAALFVMGIAYHVIPRMTGRAIAWRGAAELSFVLAFSGALLRAAAQPCLGWLRIASPLTGLSGILQLAAIGLFAAIVLRLVRGVDELPMGFVRGGTIWFLVAGVLNAVAAVRLAVLPADPVLPPEWNLPIRFVMLFGFLMAWIFGVALRTLPFFLELRAPSRRLAFGALVSLHAGVLLHVLSYLPWLGEQRLDGPFSDAGRGLVAIAALLFVPALRILQPTGRARHSLLPAGVAPALRMAFAFLIPFAALELFAVIRSFAGKPTHLLVADASLHTFTTGFVMLVIVGMAHRVVPVFGGVPLFSERLSLCATVLVAAGTVLRWLQLAAAFGLPEAYRWTSISGVLIGVGMVLFGINLWKTLGRKPQTAALPAAAIRPSDLPRVSVADLVEAYPRTLEVLVRSGFAPMANPVLRRTLGRAVTLEAACRMHGVSLSDLLNRLEPFIRPMEPPAGFRSTLPMAERNG